MVMSRRRSCLLVVIALTVAGGVLGASLEVDGAHHQREAHHCAVCCVTQHTAIPPTSAEPQFILPSVAILPVATSSDPYDEIVVRLPDPPPRFLA